VVINTHTQDFNIIVDSPSSITKARRGIPFIKQAFNAANKKKVCVTIKPDDIHASLIILL
jgi:hypothetical protein